MNTKRIENPANSSTGWINNQEAYDILSNKHGRKISDTYVRGLAKLGKITTYAPDGRTKLYWKEDVESYTVKKQGTGEVRRAIREKREAKERQEA